MSNITEVVGDVVTAFQLKDINIIAHGCNCQGVMGSGVALAVRDRLSPMYNAYMDRYHSVGLVLGDFSNTFDGVQWGFNLNTQYTFGNDGNRHVDYGAIRNSAKLLVRQVEKDIHRTHYDSIGDLTIGIPKIGAGLGGGDWDTIIGLISKEWHVFKEVRVYVLE